MEIRISVNHRMRDVKRENDPRIDTSEDKMHFGSHRLYTTRDDAERGRATKARNNSAGARSVRIDADDMQHRDPLLST